VAGRLRSFARWLPDHARTALWGLVSGRRGPPRVVVQGVVLGPDGVLLSVRVDLRGWELPGGNPDPGEAEAEALAREILEETGVRVEVERLVGSYHREGFLPHVARVYRCRAVGGAPRPSLETPRVAWWDPERPPATLLPWYRGPLRDALAPQRPPVERHERQGLAAIWAGFVIDLRMRWSGDRAG
jgi:8-oxo-dGTP diphosphatase